VKKFFLTYLAIMLMPLTTAADIIFFNDGMKTVCQDRAWEEGGEIKCEYQGSILTYQKSDVLRIEKTKIVKEPETPNQTKEAVLKPTSQAAEPSVERNPSASKETSAVKKESQPSPDDSESLKTKGLEFYNPRRPHKYWTSPTNKHDTFKAAVAALAKQYDRSADWIQHHMGTTNDLDQIHRNLSNSKLNAPSEIQAPEGDKSPEILFYNPRRPHKYWTSATAKHDTFKEAVSALAKAYDRPPEWVQQHMGKTNNLSEIHANLAKSKSADASP
jgi:ribonuclease HI